MGPQSGIVSDITDTTDIPETKIQEEDLANEKNMAKFSKSKEYQKLREYLENRMEFFRVYLPDGRPVAAPNSDPKMAGGAEVTIANWIAANVIIGEFKAVLQAYENANEAVTNVARRNKTV